jgi:hypothetical protein
MALSPGGWKTAHFLQGGEMVDFDPVSELKAKEKSREHLIELLRRDPSNWTIKLTIQSLDAEIRELENAVCITEMKQCG